jgi:hypothetical protein
MMAHFLAMACRLPTSRQQNYAFTRNPVLAYLLDESANQNPTDLGERLA